MSTRVALGLAIVAILIGGTSCAQDDAKAQKKIVIATTASKGGWLGVMIEDMTPRLARRMDVKTEEGALINEIVEDSPAEKAGLKEDDIIVEFNGRPIADSDDLRSAVGKTKPGTTVAVTVMRRGEKKTVQAEIAKSSTPQAFAYGFTAPVPPRLHVFTSNELYGMTLMDLGDQLAEFFEAPGGRGILVQEVRKKSAAAKAGVRAGDVILKVGSDNVYDTDDLRSSFEDAKVGDKLNVTILRKGKQSSLTLEVDEEADAMHSGYHSIHVAPPAHLESLDETFEVEVPEPPLRSIEKLEIKRERDMQLLEERLRSLQERTKEAMQRARATMERHLYSPAI